MIYCSNCGTANRDGSRFCNECGSRLGTLEPCPSCGFQNSSTARFCNNCGAPVSFASASGTAENQPSTIEEDEPLESDAPPAFELGLPSDSVSDQDLSEAFDLEEFSEVGDSMLEAAANEGPFTKPRSDVGVLGLEITDDVLQSADSPAQWVFDDEPAEEDVASSSADGASITQAEEELIGDFLAVYETHGEAEMASGAEMGADGALPSWMLNDEDGAISTIDIPRTREADGRRSGSAFRNGSADDDHIVLSASLASSRRVVALKADSVAFPDAGKVFETAQAQPWQMMRPGTQPEGAAVVSRAKAEPGQNKKTTTPLPYVIVVVIFLLAAIFSYLYITQPGLANSLGKEGSVILEKLTDLVSRFIK